MNMTLKTTKAPPIVPMMIAPTGETPSHGAVIATKPAKAPFNAIDASGFFMMIHETIIATIAPAAADRFVVTAM